MHVNTPEHFKATSSPLAARCSESAQVDDNLQSLPPIPCGLVAHYAHDLRRGMTDENLGIALHNVFGVFAAARIAGLHLAYRGRGLLIWASHAPLDTETAPPLWRGRETADAARAIYAIGKPPALPHAATHLLRPGAAFRLPPCAEAPPSSLLIRPGPSEGPIR